MLVAAIAKAVLPGIFDSLFGNLRGIFSDYQNRKISEAEFDARIKVAISMAQAEIETAWANAAAKVYAEAQQTIRASFGAKGWFTRNTWAFVVWSQTCVLLWYQVGLPLTVYLFSTGPIPRTGDDLLKWAYALVGGALGIGVMQMSRSSWVEKVKGKALGN